VESLQCSPDLLTGFKGAVSRHRGKNKVKREEEREERKWRAGLYLLAKISAGAHNNLCPKQQNRSYKISR